MQGRIRERMPYVAYDALATYLLRLRAVRGAPRAFITPDAYDAGQAQLAALLRAKRQEPENGHFCASAEPWRRLQELQRGGVQAIHASLPASVPAEDAA
jgi:hypothetical protein